MGLLAVRTVLILYYEICAYNQSVGKKEDPQDGKAETEVAGDDTRF